jgi:hypothetical protein
MSKKRRNKGSRASALSGCAVEVTAMFTTAGVTRFSNGASEGRWDDSEAMGITGCASTCRQGATATSVAAIRRCLITGS